MQKIYDLHLIDTREGWVIASAQTLADSREDALAQRPDDWPISRTRASLARRG